MNRLGPRERLLLLKASRLDPPREVVEEIKALASGPIDWDVFRNESIRHGVVGQIYRNLKPLEAEAGIPAEVMAELKKAYIMIAASGLTQIGQFESVATALQDTGLDVIVLKGAALASSLYGDLGLRPISDVDLLVREADWPGIYAILVEKGFKPPPGKEFIDIPPKLTRYDVQSHMQWVSGGNSCLEFQFDLYTLGIGMLDLEGAWARSRPAEIFGAKARILSPEDQLLHLVVHANRHGCARLKWLVDIAESLRKQELIDWRLLVEIARREKVDACAYLTLAHIQRVFQEDLVPGEVMRSLEPNRLKKAVWNHAWPQERLDQFEGRYEDAISFYFYRPFSGWNLLNFILMDRIRDKLAYQARWIVPSLTWMSQVYGKPKSLALLRYYPRRIAEYASRKDRT